MGFGFGCCIFCMCVRESCDKSVLVIVNAVLQVCLFLSHMNGEMVGMNRKGFYRGVDCATPGNIGAVAESQRPVSLTADSDRGCQVLS